MPPVKRNRSTFKREEKKKPCVLCLEKKNMPTTITCGHSFCFHCIQEHKSYKMYAWAKLCPICRSEIVENRRSERNKAKTTSNPENPNSSLQTELASWRFQFSEDPEITQILSDFEATVSTSFTSSETEEEALMAPDAEQDPSDDIIID